MPREFKNTIKTLARHTAFFLLCSIPHIASSASLQRVGDCEAAATLAAQRVGVPVRIMRAITTVETGNTINGEYIPWAWTINVEGRGIWFNSKPEAVRYFLKQYQNGARSIDVGCFQINYKWHGQHFSSVSDMFDPLENALYAARFLKQLFAEFGEWTAATGAYHSRSQHHAQRYLTEIQRYLTEPLNPQIASLDAAKRPLSNQGNSFPLLRSEPITPRLGSLVPNLSSNRQSIFARNQRDN